MYINNRFLDFMFTNKMRYVGKGESVFMVKESQGALVITKGRIVIADPYAINYGIVISEDIPNNKFPVYTFSAHIEHHDEVHIAGFLLQFDEEAIPNEWKMCLPQGVAADEISQDGYYGVATESGNVTVCAEQTVAWLLEHLDESAKVLEDIETQINATYFSCGGVANSKLPKMEVNLLTMVGGGADAHGYPAYWGYKDGKVVCLAIDFLVVD